jgi:hypothetical protein
MGQFYKACAVACVTVFGFAGTAMAQENVRARAQIVKVIDGRAGTESMEVEPSTRPCGNLPLNIHSQKLKFECISSLTGAALNGCSISLSLSPGSSDGGHDDRLHREGRALQFSEDDIFSGESISIPKEGLIVTYQAPDISGDVVLTAQGKSPSGESLSVDPTVFHVRHSEHFQKISAPHLELEVQSHPGDGIYGTAKMEKVTSEMTRLYQLYAHEYGVTDPAPIHSEAVSLSWGGLFDIARNWQPPHCGHRWGTSIDLSSARLSAREQRALKDAALKVQFEFRVPGERPGDFKTHWHAELYN